MIAEELLFVLTGPEGRLRHSGMSVDLGLAGALLLELESRGQVGIDGRGRLLVPDATPTGDPLLDRALSVFAQRAGKKPKDVLPKLTRHLRDQVYRRLAERGALARRQGRVLWIFPTTTWPVSDVPAWERTHAELTQVLLGQAAPTFRSGALVSLVSGVDAVTKVFPDAGGLSNRELKARAKAVAEGDWAGEAVRKAISDAHAAIAAATAATAAGAAAASS